MEPAPRMIPTSCSRVLPKWSLMSRMPSMMDSMRIIAFPVIDGIRDIKDHFGRTLLQLVGIILGAGSIVATFSLSVAGKQAAMEYYKVSGGIQKIWVSNKPTGKITQSAKALASQGLTYGDVLAIQR